MAIHSTHSFDPIKVIKGWQYHPDMIWTAPLGTVHAIPRAKMIVVKEDTFQVLSYYIHDMIYLYKFDEQEERFKHYSQHQATARDYNSISPFKFMDSRFLMSIDKLAPHMVIVHRMCSSVRGNNNHQLPPDIRKLLFYVSIKHIPQLFGINRTDGYITDLPILGDWLLDHYGEEQQNRLLALIESKRGIPLDK